MPEKQPPRTDVWVPSLPCPPHLQESEFSHTGRLPDRKAAYLLYKDLFPKEFKTCWLHCSNNVPRTGRGMSSIRPFCRRRN